jgi:hypothetical protein
MANVGLMDLPKWLIDLIIFSPSFAPLAGLSFALILCRRATREMVVGCAMYYALIALGYAMAAIGLLIVLWGGGVVIGGVIVIATRLEPAASSFVGCASAHRLLFGVNNSDVRIYLPNARTSAGFRTAECLL